MPIIIEDGSQVTGANSFVTETAFDSYADSRGVSLSGINTEATLIKAADYINGLEDRLKGDKVSRDQAMSFPRTSFSAEGWDWSSDEIPRQVINAQLALALEIAQGVDPYNPVISDLPVVKERVEGAVEVQYANPSTALKVNKDQPSQVHINLLLKHSGLIAVRV